MKVKTPDELIVQIVPYAESTVIVTGRPELAVAVGVYVLPTAALVGGVLVNVMVWVFNQSIANVPMTVLPLDTSYCTEPGPVGKAAETISATVNALSRVTLR